MGMANDDLEETGPADDGEVADDPDEADLEDLDEADLEDDDIDVALDDDDEVLDDDGLDDVGVLVDDVAVVAHPTPAPAPVRDEEEDDDDDEEADADDVEASLDVILKERLVVIDDEDDDDEDGLDGEDRPDSSPLKVLPKQPGEFVCQSCFLVKHPSQMADRELQYCRDCV